MTLPSYYRDWLKRNIETLFQEQDRDAVLHWLASHYNHPKVVLIGSGFSRNATCDDGEIEEHVPLWKEVTAGLREGLGYTSNGVGPSDPLLVAEQFQETRGREQFVKQLTDMLHDKQIRPGEAHKALNEFPAEAIVTTNQLDSLLDRMEGFADERWFKVVESTDLPIARARASERKADIARQVIYLHGHRDQPKTWVFSRAEYGRVIESKPALARRVQQLLAEYPLLVLGYSLSDPDFHWLFSSIHREQDGFMPRALCVTAGPNAPLNAEKSHWRQMGMHLAHLEWNAAPPAPLRTGWDDVGQKVARFLRLESTQLAAQNLVDQLSKVDCGSYRDTIRERLSQFPPIVRELSSSASPRESIQSLRYKAWTSCIPDYPKRATSIEVAIPPLSGTSPNPDVTPTQSSAREESRRFKHLGRQFDQLTGPSTTPLLETADTLLDLGEKDVLSEWLKLAREFRVRPQEVLSFGEDAGWALELLFQEYLPEPTHRDRGERAAASMEQAFAASLKADFSGAASHYEQASKTYRLERDEEREWFARVSRRAALQAQGFLSRDRAEADETLIDSENRKIADLESTRAIRDVKSRRNRIVEAALRRLAEARGREKSPGRVSYNMSTAETELWSLLEEDQALGLFPNISRPLASLLVQLNETSHQVDGDIFRIGIKYATPELAQILERQPNGLLSNQLLEDQKLCELLVRACEATPDGPTPSLPPTVAALVLKVMPRLTQPAVNKLLPWLKQRRESIAPEHAFTHAFGVTSATVVDQAIVALTWFAVPPQGESSWSLLQTYSEKLDISGDDAEFWRSCSTLGWGIFLQKEAQHFDSILEWHLKNEPQGEHSHHHQPSWLESLAGVLRAGKNLGLQLSAAHVERLKALSQGRVSAAGGQAYLAVLEFLEGRDRLVASLNSPPSGWSSSEKYIVALNLAQLGQTSSEQMNPSFREQLESSLDGVLALPLPDDEFSVLESSFCLVTSCLTLEIGSAAELREWLQQCVCLRERAPLHLLASTIDAERWEGEEQTNALLTALFGVNSSVRDYHMLRLAYQLCAKAREQSQVLLGSSFWLSCCALAMRCVDAKDRTTASMAVNALLSLLDNAKTLDLEARQRRRLIAAAERCAKHPKSTIRLTAGYRFGELRGTANDADLQELSERLMRGEDGLLADESAQVSSYTRYGLALGNARQRDE